MAKAKVVVIGAAGKMGKMLTAAVCANPDCELAGATEVPGHPALGKDAGQVAGLSPLGVSIVDDLARAAKADTVVIDFTTPAATVKNSAICADAGAAMVIGTTGMTDDDKAQVEKAAAKIPVVLAPNMSTGMNLLFYLVEKAARVLGESFDIEIVEAHHRLKKDAPSGTALGLARAAAKGRGWDLKDVAKMSRDGMIGARPDKQIGIQTLRGGDIVGDHTVLFAGPGERIELSHQAHSRETFAKGAVRAVLWVAGKSPGLYTMTDVLGIGD